MKQHYFWNDFFRRLILTSVSTIAIILLIAYSDVMWVQPLVLIFIGAIGAIATWEYVKLLEAKDLKVPLNLIVVGSISIMVSFFLTSHLQSHQLLPVAVLFSFVLLIFFTHFNRTSKAIIETASASFALFYIAVPIGMFFSILYFNEGKWWIAYLLVVTKIADVAAYFGGKSIGRKKLAQRISPNKTIEGALIGFFAAFVASLCFSYYSKEFFGPDFSFKMIEAVILGAVLGITGQLGDLAESLFKRDAKLKDSNRLPGLGGFLDMSDSLLFNLPILYLFLYWY